MFILFQVTNIMVLVLANDNNPVKFTVTFLFNSFPSLVMCDSRCDCCHVFGSCTSDSRVKKANPLTCHVQEAVSNSRGLFWLFRL